MSEFDYYKQGIFKHKKKSLCIFAHYYFRRSQSRFNNFFFTFLDNLVGLAQNGDVTIRIKIDPDMIGYSPSCTEIGELAYHYGPKYSDRIEQIRPGITRHESSELDRKFSGVAATEFYGKHDDNHFTFEVEEIKDFPAGSAIEQYACRYVHAIYDKKLQTFHHFDGAIRSYNFESITERVSQSFIQAGRKADYTKLFRIDGKLPIGTWKSLVSHYYQENPLIYEYFDIDISHLKNQSFTNTPDDIVVLPYQMEVEQGLRILLSYHEIRKLLEQGRYVDIFDVLGENDKNQYFIEHNIFELKFALAKLGEVISISNDIDIIKFDDDLWNIPSIMHTGSESNKLVTLTIKAMCNLFRAMISNGIRKKISLTLSYIVNDRIARISSFGTMENQVDWLSGIVSLPTSESDLTNWVTSQRQYLNQFAPDLENYMDEALLQQDGVLYIKRVQILKGFNIKPSKSGGYSIFLSDSDTPKELIEMCRQKQIRPIAALKLNKIVWADTGEDYFTANRSKWMDQVTSNLVIQKWEPIAIFWAKQY